MYVLLKRVLQTPLWQYRTKNYSLLQRKYRNSGLHRPELSSWTLIYTRINEWLDDSIATYLISSLRCLEPRQSKRYKTDRGHNMETEARPRQCRGSNHMARQDRSKASTRRGSTAAGDIILLTIDSFLIIIFKCLHLCYVISQIRISMSLLLTN